MRRSLAFLPLALLAATLNAAPRQPPPPILSPAEALRADFIARAGTDTVFFGAGSSQLGAPARAVLQAQAVWLLQHPGVPVRIEGHGEPADTRDHALAMGAERAEEVRNALILLGVPAAQVSAMSWGKERPGSPRAVTVLVQ